MSRDLPQHWRQWQLTPNFRLGEFVVSETYPEIASMIKPIPYQITNAYLICSFLLQPIRDAYGPLIVNSGLRDRALGLKLGGVRFGQHFYLEAVDFFCPKAESMIDVFYFIIQELKWKGEVILYRKKGHIHAALPTPYVKPDQFIDPS